MNLKSINPKTGEELAGTFSSNSIDQMKAAVADATAAFSSYSMLSAEQRAKFLEAIADEILALGDELIERVSAESGLPIARITGERGRTMNQLKLFASHLREGSWTEASIDTAIPDREPIPKPDLRKMLMPIGPVVVFGASNFPLAFSTAGGDTASALAAGNPVIVKGHNAHLGTNQMVSQAIQRACESQGLPIGVYQTLISSDFTLGQELVKHPDVKAVGFTGSFAGGKALYDLAVRRKSPIPVYAEMSSINPVVLLPNAVKNNHNLAANLAGSINLGAGQFCTNPGLVLAIDNAELSAFTDSLKGEVEKLVGTTMLHKGIHETYEKCQQAARSQEGVELLATANANANADQLEATPVVATTSGAAFLANPKLSEEIFGPYSLLVKCESKDQLEEVLRKAEGQLTITFITEGEEIEAYADLVSIAQNGAGRVIFNGMPTGVEVCHSMVHGGPFPATTDSRTTSVGTDAIKRFARPVCFQSAPAALLPADLRDENPNNIWRTVNGELTKEAL